MSEQLKEVREQRADLCNRLVDISVNLIAILDSLHELSYNPKWVKSSNFDKLVKTSKTLFGELSIAVDELKR
jgi:hypothetical protein